MFTLFVWKMLVQANFSQNFASNSHKIRITEMIIQTISFSGSEVGSNPSTPMSTPTMPRKNAAPSIEAQSASSALQRARDMQVTTFVDI